MDVDSLARACVYVCGWDGKRDSRFGRAFANFSRSGNDARFIDCSTSFPSISIPPRSLRFDFRVCSSFVFCVAPPGASVFLSDHVVSSEVLSFSFCLNWGSLVVLKSGKIFVTSA